MRSRMDKKVWLLSVLMGVQSAFAGPNENAKIVVHLASPTFQVSCDVAQAQPVCSDVRTNGTLYPEPGYWAFLLVTDGDDRAGIAGMEVGLDYNPGTESGVHIFSWSLCGSSENPFAGVNGPWPAPGSGNRISWDAQKDCQRFEPGGSGTGVVAASGYFYVAAYTPDNLSLVSNPGSGLATVTSCGADVDTVEGGGVIRVPSHLGFASFSQNASEPGYNPCGLNTPTENSTWSDVKRMYR